MIAARRRESGVLEVAMLGGFEAGDDRREEKREWRKRKMVLRSGVRSQYSRSWMAEDDSSSMPQRAA